MKTKHKIFRLINSLGFYQDFSTETEAISAWLDCGYSNELDLLTICE